MSLPAAGGARPGSLRAPDSLRCLSPLKCLFITALRVRSRESRVLQRPEDGAAPARLSEWVRRCSGCAAGRAGAERGTGEALHKRCPRTYGGSLGAVPFRSTAREGLGRCRCSESLPAAALQHQRVPEAGVPRFARLQRCDGRRTAEWDGKGCARPRPYLLQGREGRQLCPLFLGCCSTELTPPALNFPRSSLLPHSPVITHPDSSRLILLVYNSLLHIQAP